MPVYNFPGPRSESAIAQGKRPGFEDLLANARYVRDLPEYRNSHVGMTGYGSTKAGDRILLAVDTHYDPLVVEAVATALREKDARVDVLWVDVVPDREFNYEDEIRVMMRREPWDNNPRRWEGIPWIEALAEREKYDLLIHGKGGPILQNTPYRYAQLPWMGLEHFTEGATQFPQEVLVAANQLTWDNIWIKGRGGKVRLTDPEGTDLTFTLFEEYFDGTHFGWVAEPRKLYGHLMCHPTLPMIEKADTTGVVSGTTSHYTRCFPWLKVRMENGCVKEAEGGGPYGDFWREFLKETRDTQYPYYPRPGLFWLFEMALCGHPKISRPSNIHMLSSGGSEWERRRSGIIHMGFGTLYRHQQEVWAYERGLLYGHLHIHLFFPTYEITTKEGESIKIVDKGRFTAFDDPGVREVAAKYGDPDQLLREEWIPAIPGINVEGNYEDYARNPEPYIYTARERR